MYDSKQLILVVIAVGWSTVKWRVDQFCVYLTELRWYAVDFKSAGQTALLVVYRSLNVSFIRKGAITLKTMRFS